MAEPITQAQDHDRRIGRLEGIVEQLDRRLEGIERAIGELSRRIDTLTRWIIGIQIASLNSHRQLAVKHTKQAT